MLRYAIVKHMYNIFSIFQLLLIAYTYTKLLTRYIIFTRHLV